LIELDPGEKRLDKIGGNPRLDAFGFASQERFAYLRNNILLKAEDDDIDHFVMQRLDEAFKPFLTKIKLRLDFKILPGCDKNRCFQISRSFRNPQSRMYWRRCTREPRCFSQRRKRTDRIVSNPIREQEKESQAPYG
jgi:hypothetical protein